VVLLAAPDVQLSNWAPQLGTCPRLWRGPGRGTAPHCGVGSPRAWGTCGASGRSWTHPSRGQGRRDQGCEASPSSFPVSIP